MPNACNPLIFINYRRSVSNGAANLLDVSLRRRYREEAIFRDNRTIEAGCQWKEAIRTAIDHCAVVITLISPGWLECAYGKDCDPTQGEVRGRRRLDNPEDYVRLEMEWALQRQAATGRPLIIPIYTDGRKPYAKDHFPKDTPLAALADIQDIFTLDTRNPLGPQLAPLLAFLESRVPELGAMLRAGNGALARDEFVELLEQHYPLPDDVRLNPPASSAPYMDLMRFREPDARLFFGRSRQTYEVCQRLCASACRLLLLHGLPGVGKSSLLDAGVRPRLRQQGWSVLYAARRNYPDGGLTEALQTLQHQYTSDEQRPALFILDQAEEALTNPLVHPPLPDELTALAQQLTQWLQQHPKHKTLLAFRKEYLPEVKKALQQANTYVTLGEAAVEEYFLQPLDRQGVLEAIRGTYQDENLRRHYHNFRFEPEDLPEDLARDLARDSGSNVAPLLQVQLLDLWKAACHQAEPPVLSKTLLEQTRYKNLDAFLQRQLERLTDIFENRENVQGLALDMLHFFTTAQSTAASHTPQQVAQAYGHQPQYLALLRNLSELYLLLDNSHDPYRPYWRLAHDALAPVVRARFERREYASQRAWYVATSKSSGFSHADVELLVLARPYLRQLDEALWAALQRDAQAIEEARTRQRQDRAYVLQRLENDFWARTDQTDYVGALEAFEAVLRYEPQQCVPLRAGIEEALFFQLEAGHSEQAHQMVRALAHCWPEQAEALQLLIALTDIAALRQGLQRLYGPDGYAQHRSRLYPEMLPIASGAYTMGRGEHSNEPPHPVEVSAFRLARMPVTVRQMALFCACAKDAPPLREFCPHWGLHADHPVVHVSWYNAVEYLNWLSRQHGLRPAYQIDKQRKDPNNLQEQDRKKWTVARVPDAEGYRLPTEAEWEYAARGGAASRERDFAFAGSDNWDEVGWYRENSDGQTQPVGRKKANALGLHDMSGNAYEWCWDWYDADYYRQSPRKDPAGPAQGRYRVLRGGSWWASFSFARASFRNRVNPDNRSREVGFRAAQDDLPC